MKITKYPQSCIFIQDYKGKNILIDLGTYVFEMMDIKPEDFKMIDIILITHQHGDHCDIEALKTVLKNSDAVLLSNKETHEFLKENGINSEIIEVGQEKDIGGIKINGVKNFHGYLPTGKRKPDNIGFLIDDKFYHTGDTIYMEEKPAAEIIFIPICGRVVMDVYDAAKFCKEGKYKIAIPIHQDNPNYPSDVADFENELKEIGCDTRVVYLKNGEKLEE